MRLATLPGLGAAMMRMGPKGPDDVKSTFARVAGEHAAEHLDPALTEAALRAQRIPGAARSFRTLIASVLSLTGPRRGGLTDDDLAAVRAPVLLVWGRGDVYGDAAVAERARDAHSNVSLLIVEGGHLPWIDDPEQVGGAVRAFLDARRTHR